MAQIRSKEATEAAELIVEVCSWTEDEVNALPRFYQEKAIEYRRLANTGPE